MSSSVQDRIIEWYYQSTPFQQLVIYPTLAPQFVPAHVKENLMPTSFNHSPQKSPIMSTPVQGMNFGSVITNGQGPQVLGSPIDLPDSPLPANNGVPLLQEADKAPHDIIVIRKEFLINISVSALQAMTSDLPRKHGKAKIQKVTTVKQLRLALEGMSYKDFISGALHAHKLFDDYKAEFPFKLWWTGSPGGQKGAATISTHLDFEISLQSIVHKLGNCNVMISFDLDEMSAFRKAKRPFALLNLPDNGGSGDVFKEDVPWLENYSDSARSQWKCQEHKGEHGEPGFCFVKPDGDHLGLNTRCLGAWGSAWANGDASISSPPNCKEFNGAFGNSSPTSRTRGKSGPRLSLPAASPTGTLDMNLINSLLTAAILPMVSRLSQEQPNQAMAPCPASSRPQKSFSLPPVSMVVLKELTAMLEAFRAETTIDIVNRAQHLAELDFTVDLLTELSVDKLVEVIGLCEGDIFRLQKFAKGWVERRNEKSRAN
ncbi:hypothetical protein EDB19DRAFT_1975132 [Suillus lakei]|nr:hypothetical protein EDB19DRAFT_1975132 [Suillus lakei]